MTKLEKLEDRYLLALDYARGEFHVPLSLEQWAAVVGLDMRQMEALRRHLQRKGIL